MTKVLKLLGRLALGFIEWLVLLIIFVAFAIRTSPVQTFLAQKATSFLAKELKTVVKIDAVDLIFFDRADLKGVYLQDLEGDTLAYLGNVFVTLKGISSLQGDIRLKHLSLEDGNINLKRDSLSGEYNYAFLQDYFSTGPSKTKKTPPAFYLSSLHLDKVDFSYNDNRKSYLTYGMDWDHLDFAQVNLEARSISIEGDHISAVIEHLSTREQSGFELTKFHGIAEVSPTGVKVLDAFIQTPNSIIQLPKFRLISKSYLDFQHFVDAVQFDSRLARSKVSFKDISYFAPQLEGMDQVVQLSGEVKRTIKDLRIENLKLATGQRTKLEGSFNLPDFRNLESSYYKERLQYAFIDLNDIQNIKFPKSAGNKRIELDKYINRLGFFQVRNLSIDGMHTQFVLASSEVNTNLGSINLDNGLLFSQNKANQSYYFEQSRASEYDVKINSFDLGSFLDEKTFGLVDGTFFLSGEAFSTADIRFDRIEGNVNRFDLMDYPYTNITITEGQFIDRVLTAKMDVADDNLKLNYDGVVDLTGSEPKMNFTVDLKEALLERLGLSTEKTAALSTQFTVDLFGTDPNTLRGNIHMSGFIYKESNKVISVPDLVLAVTRGNSADRFDIQSSLATGHIQGKVNFDQIADQFANQFAQILPALVKPSDKKISATNDFFEYQFITGDLQPIFDIFVPELSIAKGTKINGNYAGTQANFSMQVESPKIQYGEVEAFEVNLSQQVINDSIKANYTIGELNYSDSIQLDEIAFVTVGLNNKLNSTLNWNLGTPNETKLEWVTDIFNPYHFLFDIKPSYFSLNEKTWLVDHEAFIELDSSNLTVTDLALIRGDQEISIDGKFAKNDRDKLDFNFVRVDLEELSSMLALDVSLAGKLNGWGYISNPYENLNYVGDAHVEDLFINQEEVGDVFVQSEWDTKKQNVFLAGDLIYKDIQTFNFKGNYNIASEKDNLDFLLSFEETDISFVNGFLNPEVVKNIQGYLNGDLLVRGSINEPEIEGDVIVNSGGAFITMLGTSFTVNGNVYADKDGFYIDNMPITDMEGNNGTLIGSVFHDNFSKWNFDINLNLEDDAYKRDAVQTWRPVPLEKFLVLNTAYKEGDVYYGKAYGTGTVNIFGYADNLEITVDMKTRKGTAINFPMYGSSDLSAEEDFITFKSKDTAVVDLKQTIDFTGVKLDLNFNVTEEADLKIIFNENTGDQITARGSGLIGVRMDNLGDISMDGTYRVKDGLYNFAMGVIKQQFFIAEGGTIAWSGDPYNAMIDIQTYSKVNASLAELSPDQTNAGNQEVQCYLNLTESLLKPNISFDIKVPKANEEGKTLISRVTSDKDELNRQFFSLLLWKKFQPMKGTSGASGGAALDLVTNQINSMLSQFSDDYKMNVNLDKNDITQGNSVEFGLSKGFLDDRLVITTSVGVANSNVGEQAQSNFIGDVNLEYKLNEKGTFIVTVFNESNDRTVLQDKNLGQFTQGAGIQYQEEFESIEDFKLIQSFLDIFRKKENKRVPIRRKKEQTKVPNLDAVLPEE